MNNNYHKNILYPIERSDGTFFKTSDDIKLKIKSELILFLNTQPGERIFNPEYGLNIDDLLFEQQDDNYLFTSLSTRIKNAINNYFRNIIINDISMQSNNNVINISIKYNILNDDEIQELTIDKNLYK